MAYTKEDKQRAFALRQKSVTYKTIARRDDMPTKRTLRNWAKKGEGTDGVPWDEKIEEERRQEIVTVKAEAVEQKSGKLDDFFDEALDDTMAAFRQVASKIRMGEFEAKPKQMTQLLTLAATLKNDGMEQKALLDEMWRWNIQVCAELMDDRTFALYKAKVLEKQEQALEELSPVDQVRSISDGKELG